MACVTGLAASSRGRNFWGWFFLGFLFSAFALIAVLVMGRVHHIEPAQSDSPSLGSARRSSAPKSLSVVATYMGQDITLRDGAYWVGDSRFKFEVDARNWIRTQKTQNAIHGKPVELIKDNTATIGLRTIGDGYFDQIVVGTSKSQSIIASLPDQSRKFLVTLTCQRDNPHDRNAVAVLHSGKSVGFLPREDALEWRDALAEAGHHMADVQAYARVARSDEHVTLGLRLDIDWPPTFSTRTK